MEGFGPGAKSTIPDVSITAATFKPLVSVTDVNPDDGSVGNSLPGGKPTTIVFPPPISPTSRSLTYKNFPPAPQPTLQKLQMRIGGPPCIGRAITGLATASNQSP